MFLRPKVMIVSLEKLVSRRKKLPQVMVCLCNILPDIAMPSANRTEDIHSFEARFIEQDHELEELRQQLQQQARELERVRTQSAIQTGIILSVVLIIDAITAFNMRQAIPSSPQSQPSPRRNQRVPLSPVASVLNHSEDSDMDEDFLESLDLSLRSTASTHSQFGFSDPVEPIMVAKVPLQTMFGFETNKQGFADFRVCQSFSNLT